MELNLYKLFLTMPVVLLLLVHERLSHDEQYLEENLEHHQFELIIWSVAIICSIMIIKLN